MIFSNNSTALGAGSIPMAEGYDCSFGPALALVEGARNDYAMFRAMLNVESRELQIRNESAGYVTEGEIAALAEAAGAGIWTKIKELFSKLIAKIKAIFHNFMAKLNSLTKSDKDMVKKYKVEILKKGNIENLEVKWRKVKSSPIDKIASNDVYTSIIQLSSKWNEDANARFKEFAGSEPDEYEVTLMGEFFDDDDATTYQIKEIGGIRKICDYLEAFEKKNNNITKFVNQISTSLGKLVKEADDKVKIAAKSVTSNDPAEKDLENANHAYDMAVAYQDYMLKRSSIVIDAIKIEYKQNKAAFMKAIAANNKKLAEATLLSAIAEEAEQEVEDVISGSIDDVDLTNTNNASTNVLDPGVSSDPDELVYADDPDYAEADTAGTVDTNVNSREESAFFGKMLY
jgi:hypothetical protein